MKLAVFLKEYVAAGEKILVYADIDVGAKENFSVEIMRGQSCHRWRDEYWDWLVALDLEVDHVGYVAHDACGNDNLLTIKCKPIKLANWRDAEC